MAAPTTLAVDTVATQEQATQSSVAKTQPSTFDSILNTASYASGVFGPVAVESVYAASGSEPASIVAAAVNATANPYSSSTSYLSTSSGLGYSGSSNYLTGGYSGSSMYGETGSSTSAEVESVLSESYANQAYLIAVQAELGNIQTSTNSLSNALNVKHSTMKSVINNFRVG